MKKDWLPKISIVAFCAFFMMLFFSISRLLYFTWNYDFFTETPLTELWRVVTLGWRVDASIAAYFWTLILLITFFLPWRKTWAPKVIFGFMLLLLPLFIADIIDVEFSRFVLRRISNESLFLFATEWGFIDIFKNYYKLFIIGIAILSTLYLFLWKALHKIAVYIRRNATPYPVTISAKIKRFSFVLALNTITVIVLIMITRGNIAQSRPISMGTLPEGRLGLLGSNSSFTFFHSLGKSLPPQLHYFTDNSQLIDFLKPKPIAFTHLRNPPKNVVVIILESLSMSYMGHVNGVKGHTPFIDSLSESGLFFDYSFANVHHSINGVTATLSSMPSFYKKPFLDSIYGNTPIYGLGNMMASIGARDRWFFSGSNRGSMNFDNMSIKVGFNKHFAKDDFDGDKSLSNRWGIDDRPYFRFIARQLKNYARPPFGAAMFSLSAHEPFSYPGAPKDAKGVEQLLYGQEYADKAVHDLFTILKEAPWFKDTLFVITGDHGQQVALPQYRKNLGFYRIPIIFWQQGRDWSTLKSRIDMHQAASQIDILPTIADLMNIHLQQRNWLGRSLVSTKPRPIVVKSSPNTYIVTKDAILRYLQKEDETKLTLIDPKAKINQEEASKTLKRYGQAVLQYYYNGVRKQKVFFNNP